MTMLDLIFRVKILRALPSWLLIFVLKQPFPESHIWRNITFRLSDWYKGQTHLCRQIDYLVWILLIDTIAALIWLYIKY